MPVSLMRRGEAGGGCFNRLMATWQVVNYLSVVGDFLIDALLDMRVLGQQIAAVGERVGGGFKSAQEEDPGVGHDFLIAE